MIMIPEGFTEIKKWCRADMFLYVPLLGFMGLGSVLLGPDLYTKVCGFLFVFASLGYLLNPHIRIVLQGIQFSYDVQHPPADVFDTKSKNIKVEIENEIASNALVARRVTTRERKIFSGPSGYFAFVPLEVGKEEDVLIKGYAVCHYPTGSSRWKFTGIFVPGALQKAIDFIDRQVFS